MVSPEEATICPIAPEPRVVVKISVTCDLVALALLTKETFRTAHGKPNKLSPGVYGHILGCLECTMMRTHTVLKREIMFGKPHLSHNELSLI